MFDIKYSLIPIRFSTLLYTDPVTFYSILSGYRTKEYAQTAMWVLLEPADLLFTSAKQLIFNENNGKLNKIK